MVSLNEIPLQTIAVIGGIAVLGLGVYEFLKPQSQSISPSGTTTVNPTVQNNPPNNYTPTIQPQNTQSASVGQQGVYYAINYSPVSTYAPYNYAYTSSTVTKTNTITPTYTASGFGSSVYGAGSTTSTAQPLSGGLLNLFGGGVKL